LERLHLNVEETTTRNGVTIGLQQHRPTTRGTARRDMAGLAAEDADRVIDADRLEMALLPTAKAFAANRDCRRPSSANLKDLVVVRVSNSCVRVIVEIASSARGWCSQCVCGPCGCRTRKSTVDLGFAWAKIFLLCVPKPWTTGSIMAIFISLSTSSHTYTS
jgi:hypothetical protein